VADNRAGEWAGDLWGGLAAMLVVLPAALAFGVAISGRWCCSRRFTATLG